MSNTEDKQQAVNGIRRSNHETLQPHSSLSELVCGGFLTHDDLGHEREQIIRLLSEKGFDISAYEQSDFSKPLFLSPPDQTSRAICLDALARADISLLIINKRAGLTLDGKYAITHEEEYIASIQENLSFRIEAVALF